MRSTLAQLYKNHIEHNWCMVIRIWGQLTEDLFY
nr:MAG TPA: hypothetical protein [Caudoviricetes sp.]